jgi:hypothetical protein
MLLGHNTCHHVAWTAPFAGNKTPQLLGAGILKSKQIRRLSRRSTRLPL